MINFFDLFIQLNSYQSFSISIPITEWYETELKFHFHYVYLLTMKSNKNDTKLRIFLFNSRLKYSSTDNIIGSFI